MAVLPEFLSILTETDANMNLGENAARERRKFHATAPAWAWLLGVRWRWFTSACADGGPDIIAARGNNPRSRLSAAIASPNFSENFAV